MPSQDLVKSIIAAQHPEYVDKLEAWKRNERRFQAGEDVYDELTKFRWEDASKLPDDEREASKIAPPDVEGYRKRKSRAVYPELPAQASEKFVGLLTSEKPTIDWGSLGEIREEPEGNPTAAEIIFENADGTGHDARGFDQFWSDAMQNAMATKFRWILVEAPPGVSEGELTLQDELDGQRPYFVEYSPVAVPNWLYERGTLQFARIELERRVVAIGDDGKLKDENETIHYLLVKQGFDGFGEEFAAGGWWMFDKEGLPVTEAEKEMAGTWDKTGGHIPLFRLYYERGNRADKRTGITHLGNIAVSYMDVLSWMWHDAFVSGSRKRYFLGVDFEQWKTITDAELDGGVDVPVPGKEGGGSVNIHDTGGVSAHDALLKLIQQFEKLALTIIMRELVTSPDASGASRRLEFLQGNSPRLANMAKNIEEAQTIGLHFLEMRWGKGQPSGSVKWPKKFDLRTAIERLRDFFDLFTLVGAKSPTLVSDLLTDIAKQEGFVVEGEESELETIRNEIQTSLDVQLQGGQTGSPLEALRRRRAQLNGGEQ